MVVCELSRAQQVTLANATKHGTDECIFWAVFNFYGLSFTGNCWEIDRTGHCILAVLEVIERCELEFLAVEEEQMNRQKIKLIFWLLCFTSLVS